MIYEICVDSIDGVRAAKAAGAHRVELCANLLEGGTTPSLGMIRRARTIAGIKLHVIIRPRGGDFLYDADELAMMETDIDAAKADGADGIVIGLLNPDGTIDVERTRALVARARPMAVTFHRAFDMTPDAFAALDTLIGLGIERVLTTGQEPSSLEGLPLLERLFQHAAGRIIVMPGGMTPKTMGRIAGALRPAEVHFAALAPVASGMRFRREGVFMGGELRPPEYDRPKTSEAFIRAVIAAAP
jgi:copper homeostasis protein